MWLHTEETKTSSSDNGSIASVTGFQALTYLSPTKIAIDLVASSYPNISPPYIAVSDSSTGLSVIEAETMGTASPFSAVNDAAKIARGGTILRYTPSGTVENSCYASISSMSQARTLGVLMNYRNSSVGTTFKVRTSIQYGSTMQQNYGSFVSFSGGSPYYTRWALINVISIPAAPINFFFNITASGTVGTFDVDSFVIVDLTNPASSIISVGENNSYSLNGGTIVINHGMLTNATSLVTRDTFPSGYIGNPVICTKGTAVYGLLLQTGGTASADQWRCEKSGVPNSNTWTAARYTAYLVPR